MNSHWKRTRVSSLCWWSALLLVSASWGASACSGDSKGDDSSAAGAPGASGGNGGNGGEGGAGEPNEGGAPNDEGIIATLTRVCSPESCMSYLNIYESLDELADEGTLDRSKSIEVPYSQGRVFNGSIYLFSRGEQPEVTRWSVEADRTVKKRETVSFATTGTTVFCEICNIFGSKDLAFHLDATSGTLVSWNPTKMEIVDISEIPESLTGKLAGGYADFLFPRVYDGRAFFNAGWSNSDVPEVYGRAAVLAFDVKDSTPQLDLIEDDRCGGTWAMAPFADDTGNVYVMGDWNGGYYQAGVVAPVSEPACLLRVKPGAKKFDPDYYVDLLEVLDAKAVRNAFSMAGGKLLLNILPAAAAGVSQEEIEEDPWAYYSLQEFRYVVLDLESLEVTPVAALGDVAAGSATQLRVDDRSFLQIYDETRSANLYEIRGDGSAKKIVFAGSNADFDMIGRVR